MSFPDPSHGLDLCYLDVELYEDEFRLLGGPVGKEVSLLCELCHRVLAVHFVEGGDRVQLDEVVPGVGLDYGLYSVSPFFLRPLRPPTACCATARKAQKWSAGSL